MGPGPEEAGGPINTGLGHVISKLPQRPSRRTAMPWEARVAQWQGAGLRACCVWHLGVLPGRASLHTLINTDIKVALSRLRGDGCAVTLPQHKSVLASLALHVGVTKQPRGIEVTPVTTDAFLNGGGRCVRQRNVKVA